jgi:hypothetical protein
VAKGSAAHNFLENVDQPMDIEFLLRRQALMEWRDRWFTQAISTINSAAIRV